MKRLTLYILIILFLTCGCTKSNLNSDETFSQPSNQEKITNHTISLNKEEPQPQEKEQKEELEENLHPIDKAERDCIEKQDSTQAMNECTYKARDEEKHKKDFGVSDCCFADGGFCSAY